ncbi:MAG: hypothetical protein M3478_06690 [Planctomycetota bacterium]|nr:hypothetical protein [Planctomycetota bacterium]
MHRHELFASAVPEIESVYRLAHRFCRGSNVCAASLVEETYAVALRIPDGVPPSGKSVRLWLYSVLHAVLRARLANDVDADPLDDARTCCASADAAAKILAWYHLSHEDWDRVDARLDRAIDELPLRHRVVFLLWSCEGLSTRQIASVVNAGEPIVRDRLLRATMAVATQLGEVATGWLAEPALDGAGV